MRWVEVCKGASRKRCRERVSGRYGWAQLGAKRMGAGCNRYGHPVVWGACRVWSGLGVALAVQGGRRVRRLWRSGSISLSHPKPPTPFRYRLTPTHTHTHADTDRHTHPAVCVCVLDAVWRSSARIRANSCTANSCCCKHANSGTALKQSTKALH
jgi:hypothetical protein